MLGRVCGREHDAWEPAEMLDNTEALEIYLQGLVKSKKELPPGVPSLIKCLL